MTKSQKPKDIDGYISQFPADVQGVLQDVRDTIRRAAPDAEETISYLMPAFRQTGFWSTSQPGRTTSAFIRRSLATRPWRMPLRGTPVRRAISSSHSTSRCPST